MCPGGVFRRGLCDLVVGVFGSFGLSLHQCMRNSLCASLGGDRKLLIELVYMKGQ